jgi:hypothetical protein
MIGHNTSIIEFEFFTMVYVLTAMHQLAADKLLQIPNLPSIINTPSYETIIDLSQKYPLPTYDMMAEYGYRILAAHNKILSFTQEDLRRLFLEVEVNNGYII